MGSLKRIETEVIVVLLLLLLLLHSRTWSSYGHTLSVFKYFGTQPWIKVMGIGVRSVPSSMLSKLLEAVTESSSKEEARDVVSTSVGVSVAKTLLKFKDSNR